MPLGTEVGLGPGDIVLDGDPSLPRKGTQQPPTTFRSTSIVAKRSSNSATAELLFMVALCNRETIYIVTCCMRVCSENRLCLG